MRFFSGFPCASKEGAVSALPVPVPLFLLLMVAIF
jgi:hypothetical protein